MGGFLSGIFGGSVPTLNKNINEFGADAGFSTGLGEKDATAASTFYTDILSGDPTKEAKALAPETSAAQETAQQTKNQAAQFAPRSGGTAAAMAGLDANTRAQLIKLLGSQQAGAASGAANLGTQEQQIGLTARQMQDQAAQQRLENWMNSILGKSTQDAVQTAENAGEGAAGL